MTECTLERYNEKVLYLYGLSPKTHNPRPIMRKNIRKIMRETFCKIPDHYFSKLLKSSKAKKARETHRPQEPKEI